MESMEAPATAPATRQRTRTSVEGRSSVEALVIGVMHMVDFLACYGCTLSVQPCWPFLPSDALFLSFSRVFLKISC